MSFSQEARLRVKVSNGFRDLGLEYRVWVQAGSSSPKLQTSNPNLAPKNLKVLNWLGRGYGGPTCKNESRHAGLAARDAKKGGPVGRCLGSAARDAKKGGSVCGRCLGSAARDAKKGG